MILYAGKIVLSLRYNNIMPANSVNAAAAAAWQGLSMSI